MYETCIAYEMETSLTRIDFTYEILISYMKSKQFTFEILFSYVKLHAKSLKATASGWSEIHRSMGNCAKMLKLSSINQSNITFTYLVFIKKYRRFIIMLS